MIIYLLKSTLYVCLYFVCNVAGGESWRYGNFVSTWQ
jgi:hypothetical protein